MIFQTTRVHGELLDVCHAEALHRYYTDNWPHLAPWEPLRPEGFHSLESWKNRTLQYRSEATDGTALRIVALQPGSDEIVGVCFFSNISYGVFQACNLGYSIASRFGGQGFMTEIVDASVNHVFQQLDLHRVMANYVPENKRSARVLEKLGFEKEGLAKSYLKIAGQWRDHVLTSKINPTHQPV